MARYGGDDGGTHRRRRSRSRRLLGSAVAGLVVVAVVLGVVGPTVTVGVRHDAAPRVGSSVGPPDVVSTAAGAPVLSGHTSPAGRTSAAARWLPVLESIDARRARAWRLGDPALLRLVYCDDSAELRTDQKMLRGYLRRDLVVAGVSMSYFAVLVESERPDEVTLRVVDQLGSARVSDAKGTSEPLPRDQPTRHRIVLRLLAGQWRIARIEPG